MPSIITVDRLLSGGYLPEVLPPCFRSNAFGDAFAPGKVPPSEFLSADKKIVPLASKYATYDQTLVGNRSRRFSIPNPVHYYRLAHCVATDWQTIEAEARSSPFSLTKPVVGTALRPIEPEVDFAQRPIHRARIRATSRFIFKGDIARFFPSIYTHSIAWAFHGKAAAKSKKGDKSLLGNRLDDRLQSMQDRQTMGIPVGQDISRVIAEVVLARVEREIKPKKGTLGMRCIDDYEVGFLSQSEAEDFRHKLEISLASFELALNPLKTTILPLPQLLLDRWDSEIRAFDFGGGFVPINGDADGHDPLSLAFSGDPYHEVAKAERLLVFFNRAIDLQHQFPHEGVLRFSLVRLAHLSISNECWPLYENYLLHCGLNQPETLRLVTANLLKAEFVNGNKVDRKRLCVVVEALVVAAAPLGQSSTVTWALWIALLFDLKLSAKATRELSRSTDTVSACLTFEMRDKGLLGKRFDDGGLAALVQGANCMYEKHWLLAYESACSGWFGAKTPKIKDPCFAYLKNSGVNFYVPTAISDLKQLLTDASKRTSTVATELLLHDESGTDDDFDSWWR